MQSLTLSPNPRHTSRDTRLDQLRGLAIVAVLLLHLTPVTFMTASPQPGWRALALASVLCYQTCQLAVPVFLLISLTLFVQRGRGEPGYLRRRLRRLLTVLGAWMLVYASLGVVARIQQPIVGLWQAFRFPFTNGALYFLANLAIATVLTAALAKCQVLAPALTRHLLMVGLAISIVIVGVAEATAWDPQFWSPVGFLPYPFAALLFKDQLLGEKTLTAAFFGAVFFEAYLFLLGGLELANLSSLGYARPTVVLGSVLVYALWMKTREQHRPLLEWLGVNTLGIYLIHPLIIGTLHLWGVSPLTLRGDWGAFSFAVSLTALTAIGTLLLQTLLSRSPLRSLVV